MSKGEAMNDAELEKQIALDCECSGDKAIEIINMVRENDKPLIDEYIQREFGVIQNQIKEKCLAAVEKQWLLDWSLNDVLQAIKGVDK